MRQKKFEEAVTVHVDALDATRAVFGSDHAIFNLCKTSLGVCLTKVGRYEEAEPHLRDSYEFLVGTKHPKAKWAHKSLVALYEAWGRPAEAKRIQLE